MDVRGEKEGCGRGCGQRWGLMRLLEDSLCSPMEGWKYGGSALCHPESSGTTGVNRLLIGRVTMDMAGIMYVGTCLSVKFDLVIEKMGDSIKSHSGSGTPRIATKSPITYPKQMSSRLQECQRTDLARHHTYTLKEFTKHSDGRLTKYKRVILDSEHRIKCRQGPIVESLQCQSHCSGSFFRQRGKDDHEVGVIAVCGMACILHPTEYWCWELQIVHPTLILPFSALPNSQNLNISRSPAISRVALTNNPDPRCSKTCLWNLNSPCKYWQRAL